MSHFFGTPCICKGRIVFHIEFPFYNLVFQFIYFNVHMSGQIATSNLINGDIIGIVKLKTMLGEFVTCVCLLERNYRNYLKLINIVNHNQSPCEIFVYPPEFSKQCTKVPNLALKVVLVRPVIVFDFRFSCVIVAL